MFKRKWFVWRGVSSTVYKRVPFSLPRLRSFRSPPLPCPPPRCRLCWTGSSRSGAGEPCRRRWSSEGHPQWRFPWRDKVKYRAKEESGHMQCLIWTVGEKSFVQIGCCLPCVVQGLLLRRRLDLVMRNPRTWSRPSISSVELVTRFDSAFRSPACCVNSEDTCFGVVSSYVVTDTA